MKLQTWRAGAVLVRPLTLSYLKLLDAKIHTGTAFVVVIFTTTVTFVQCTVRIKPVCFSTNHNNFILNSVQRAYNMGLAYSLQPNYTKAKDFFNQALDVIKLRTEKLEARIAEWESKSKGKGKATDDNPCVVDRKELEELQNLYPEIKARVSWLIQNKGNICNMEVVVHSSSSLLQPLA